MGFFVAVLWALLSMGSPAPGHGHIRSMDSVGGGPAIITTVPTSTSGTSITTMDSVGGGPA